MKQFFILWIIFFNLTIFGEGSYFEKAFSKNFDPSNIESITVENVNGDIILKNTNSNEIKLNIKIKGKWIKEMSQEELLNKVIEITQKNGTLKIKINKIKRKSSLWELFSKKYPEVKISLQIPEKPLDFDIETVNGNVQCLQLKAKQFDIETVNGKISMAACIFSKRSNIETVNGSITADFSNLSNDLEASTVNGGISIRLPEHFDGKISASTINGSIKNDFGWKVKSGFGPKSLEIQLGNGTYQMDLSTINGSIKILK